jgi:hypothetical protein
MSVNPYRGEALGYLQITSLSSAVTLTGANAPPSGATYAVIQAETADVRWRDDGTAPTSSVGMPLYAGAGNAIFLGSIYTAQFIQINAGAKLNICWYR